MFLYTLGLALALAMDCFSVALGLACGLKGLSAGQTLRLAVFFGGFQFGMPVLGWLAGEKLVRVIGSFDHWVAFGLLALVGGKMIFEAFHVDEEAKAGRPDQSRGWPLLVLSLATSIDALAVGLSLGLMGLPVVQSAAIIGAGSFAMTIVGAKLGPVFGRAAGRWAEVLGGAVLIGIGVRILAGHL